MKHSAYQIGTIRDEVSKDYSTNVFDCVLDVVASAKNIKQSYSTSSPDPRMEDINISVSVSLSYAIWHVYNQYVSANS